MPVTPMPDKQYWPLLKQGKINLQVVWKSSGLHRDTFFPIQIKRTGENEENLEGLGVQHRIYFLRENAINKEKHISFLPLKETLPLPSTTKPTCNRPKKSV